jgi:hypothetical protein
MGRWLCLLVLALSLAPKGAIAQYVYGPCCKGTVQNPVTFCDCPPLPAQRDCCRAYGLGAKQAVADDQYIYLDCIDTDPNDEQNACDLFSDVWVVHSDECLYFAEMCQPTYCDDCYWPKICQWSEHYSGGCPVGCRAEGIPVAVEVEVERGCTTGGWVER